MPDRQVWHWKNGDIFEEPAVVLDTESEAEILQTISNLKQEGKYILLITHKDSTMRIADKIVKLYTSL